MKAATGAVSLSEVEDLHDDMVRQGRAGDGRQHRCPAPYPPPRPQTDMLADAAEIDELMARGYDTGYDAVDEADLDAELAGLESELAADPATELSAPAGAGWAAEGVPDAPGVAAPAPAASYPSGFPAVPSAVPHAAVPTTASRY